MRKLSFVNILVYIFLYTTVAITLKTEGMTQMDYKWWIVIGSMMAMSIFTAIRSENNPNDC